MGLCSCLPTHGAGQGERIVTTCTIPPPNTKGASTSTYRRHDRAYIPDRINRITHSSLQVHATVNECVAHHVQDLQQGQLLAFFARIFPPPPDDLRHCGDWTVCTGPPSCEQRAQVQRREMGELKLVDPDPCRGLLTDQTARCLRQSQDPFLR